MNVEKAIETAVTARQTHIQWADYFERLEDCGCEDCQLKLLLHADGVGSSEYQNQMADEYENILVCLRSLTSS